MCSSCNKQHETQSTHFGASGPNLHSPAGSSGLWAMKELLSSVRISCLGFFRGFSKSSHPRSLISSLPEEKTPNQRNYLLNTGLSEQASCRHWWCLVINLCYDSAWNYNLSFVGINKSVGLQSELPEVFLTWFGRSDNNCRAEKQRPETCSNYSLPTEQLQDLSPRYIIKGIFLPPNFLLHRVGRGSL